MTVLHISVQVVLGYIADIVTLIAFAITVWQLVSLNKKMDAVRIEAKTSQLNHDYLAKVSEATKIIELLFEHIQDREDKLVLYRMAELREILIEIHDDSTIRSHARDNFGKLVQSNAGHMVSLREAMSDGDAYDYRYLRENLQYIGDNLRLIQNYLKNNT